LAPQSEALELGEHGAAVELQLIGDLVGVAATGPQPLGISSGWLWLEATSVGARGQAIW
jgi:hypothetical protein